MFRLIGSALIVTGAALIGRTFRREREREIADVEEFYKAINFMICELEYQKKCLPEICLHLSNTTQGTISRCFAHLETLLSSQMLPDVACCAASVISECSDISPHTKDLFQMLGESLGRFDVDGQILQLKYIKDIATNTLNNLIESYKRNAKSNQTLWICTGIALAVVLF